MMKTGDIAQGEFAEFGAIMRIKQILWVSAAIVFASVLSAQGQTGAIIPSTVGHAETTPGFVPSELHQAEMQGMRNDIVEQKGPHALTVQIVLKEIKKGPAETVIKDVMDHGVDFEMNASIEKKLRKANANDQVVDAVRQAGPKEREQMAKLIIGTGETGFQSIPKEQAQAFDAIKVESDPDKEIALINDFAKKYPDSPVLSYAYGFEANAYEQKGDLEKVVEYSGKGLKLKPDNIMCLIFSLGMLPMPQYLNAHPADREKILEEAESEANRALQLIPQVQKQPNEIDAHYKRRQTDLTSEVHGALGMVHLDLAIQALQGADKDELAKAEQEFNAAVTTASHPDPRDYYRLGETYRLDGKWDNAIQAFTKAGELGQGTLVKTYADEEIAQIKKTKTSASAVPKS
jgi:tetratricopeptide (TPR) repeat protein